MIGIIMAGGEGTRLRPLTCGVSKPMVSVLGRPVMEYSIELLKKHGIEKAGVTLQYLPNTVTDHFEDGKRFGTELEYFIEESPLGTAGSVKNAEGFIDKRIVVISGDALTDIDITEAVNFHTEHNARFTIVLKKIETPLEYGVVMTNPDGIIERFLEKPSWGEVFSDTVNTGIYIMEPEILKLIPQNTFFDFSKDLFPLMMKKGINIHGFVADGYWCDIGDSVQYAQAQFDILDGRVNVRINAAKISGNVYIGKNAIIEDGAELTGPCYIGGDSFIGRNSVIGGYSVIGADCRIKGASIKRSIVWDSCFLDSNASLRGCIVCDHVQIGKDANIFENAIIGAESVIHNSAEIRPKVRIWPSKTVDEGVLVQRDIIWSQNTRRGLFGDLGIRGAINREITPEFAAAVGAAYASTLKGAAAIAYNESFGGQMIASAVSAGIMSAGVFVYDAEIAPLPVIRYLIRELALAGGVFVECDGFFCTIHLLDRHGADITRAAEKKMESVFSRCDSKRCEYDEIKYSKDIEGAELFYIRRLVRACSEIKNASFRAGVGGNKRLSSLYKNILSELDCAVFSLDYNECHEMIGSLITEKELDISVFFEDSGEITFYDDNGVRVNESLAKAFKYYMITVFKAGPTIYLPINESDELEGFLKNCGAIVERIKTDSQDQMSKIWESNASDREMHFGVLYDPVECALRALVLLSRLKVPMSRIIGYLPVARVALSEVRCPSRDKGRVIRTLSSIDDKKKVQLIDGVKIYHDDAWVLVLPENDKPMCRIYTSAFSEEYASELAVRYSDIIKGIVEGNG